MVTHGRDRGGDDVGPKLLYYDSRGKGVLKGTHLLDGCAVTLCAHVGRSDFGFDQGRKRVRSWPTSKAPIPVVCHSFRLIFGRVLISRGGLEA